MKASVTYTKMASPEIQLLVQDINEELVDHHYAFYCNWYAVEKIAEEADGFVAEAKSKLDNSMKGWKPVAEGYETHYQINHTKDGLEYSYTRYYTK